jgi:hypothetical protein
LWLFVIPDNTVVYFAVTALIVDWERPWLWSKPFHNTGWMISVEHDSDIEVSGNTKIKCNICLYKVWAKEHRAEFSRRHRRREMPVDGFIIGVQEYSYVYRTKAQSLTLSCIAHVLVSSNSYGTQEYVPTRGENGGVVTPTCSIMCLERSTGLYNHVDAESVVEFRLAHT